MTDLHELAHTDLVPCLNQGFELDPATADRLVLELIEVRPLGNPGSAGPGREPFAALFRGPLEPALPQGIHALEHPDLGRLEIFLVPVGRDPQGTRYEAVFN
jgi:hypothetical protein